MLYIPSLDLCLTSYSTYCERYLVAVAGAVVDPPYRESGYTECPEWLSDAMHLASTAEQIDRLAMSKRY